MFCGKCGKLVPPDKTFCPYCGTAVGKNTNQGNGYNSQPSTITQGTGYTEQFDDTPITMWGYFGYSILFSICFIGLVIAIIFSFGGTKNIHLRNFARSVLLSKVIGTILTLISWSIIVATFSNVLQYYLH